MGEERGRDCILTRYGWRPAYRTRQHGLRGGRGHHDTILHEAHDSKTIKSNDSNTSPYTSTWLAEASPIADPPGTFRTSKTNP